jgi:hypothetical protein
MTLVGSALALLLAGAGVRANPIPVPLSPPPVVTVSENWTPNLFKVYATGYDPSTNPNNHYISFSNEAAHSIDIPTQNAPPWLGPNQVLATNLNAASSATFDNPDKVNTDYTLSLTLTGNNGNTDTATLIFTGHLNATFYDYTGTDGKQHVFFNANNTYTSPVMQQTTLDGYTITVTLDPFAHPTTGSSNNGSIGASITASIPPGGPPDGGPTGSPEPSSLVLSFLGLSGLGAASWRKWRQRRGA